MNNSELFKILILGLSNTQTVPQKVFEEMRELGISINSDERIEFEILKSLSVYSILNKTYRTPEIQIRKDLIVKSEPELKNEINSSSGQLLDKLLKNKEKYLILEFIELINKKALRLPFYLIPAVLDFAKRNKNSRMTVAEICGKRGFWLSMYNKEWGFNLLYSEKDYELFLERGNLTERKEILGILREKSPDDVCNYIQKTWEEESIHTRIEFLKLLDKNLSQRDLILLNQAYKTSNKELKKTAVKFLLFFPESQIQKDLQCFCNEIFIISNDNIKIDKSHNFSVNEVSNRFYLKLPKKNIKNGELANIITLIVSNLHPSYWINKGFDYKNLLEIIVKDSFFSSWLIGLGYSAYRFKDLELQREIHRFFYSKEMDTFTDDDVFFKFLSDDLFNKVSISYLKKYGLKNQFLLSALNIAEAKWSDDLCILFFEALKNLIFKSQRLFNSQIKNIIFRAVYNCNPILLNKLEKNWPENMDYSLEKFINDALSILSVRKNMLDLEVKTIK